jgi:hypothetical protein
MDPELFSPGSAFHVIPAGLRIQIRMDPHYFWKLDPDPD